MFSRSPKITRRALALTFVLLSLVTLGAIYGPALVDLVSDRARVEAWLRALGPWAPLALIALNTIQIVFAPIPGYFVQAAAGYLFGVLAGGIYGAIGMLLGGALAMNLARWYGRPLVARLAGSERLQRWEGVIHSDSIWPWFLLLLGPVGDVPYYIAGLTRVSIWKILVIALLVRGPSVFVAAAVGAGVINIPPVLWLAFGALLVIAALLAHRYHDRFERWVDHTLLRRVA
ncbi:TVP38/TMEM64 family protein [Candidatus Amarolinea aalborgensis]|uniref:TVP38/TMEM64 family protein n=1 Tax=Candidatus Amarolinea aalborgensis TaxID=2249329 RepID=UPI003BF9C411